MRWGRANPDRVATAETSTHASAPGYAPVERFIREVIPAVPGGLHMSTDARGHLQLIQLAAAERGLSTTTIGRTTYFYDGRLAVGGMAGWVPTLVGREAFAAAKSKEISTLMFEAAGVPTPASIVLDPDQLDAAIAHVRAADRPLV